MLRYKPMAPTKESISKKTASEASSKNIRAFAPKQAHFARISHQATKTFWGIAVNAFF